MSDANQTPDKTTEPEPSPTDDKPTETTPPPEPTDEPEETKTDDEPDKTTSKPPPKPTDDKPPEETQKTEEKTEEKTDQNGQPTSTVVTVITPTTTFPDGTTPTPTDPALKGGSEGNNDDGGGLPNAGKIAIAVVVPVVAVALLLAAGIWFWKRRKARKDAEEERRKEVEDYAYNPNADPTLPPVGGLTSESPYDMREDTASSGYRGWGSTAVGIAGAKATSGMSGGGHTAAGYSDSTNRRNPSDGARSGDIMMDSRDGAYSPESGEILGAMGPSVAGNRADIRRGPSNASSSYSAGGRSDGSDGAAGSYANQYYDQYTGGNPYAADAYGQRPAEGPGAPVIRDNPARRNTRIENPSHYPQQSAGISQNF